MRRLFVSCFVIGLIALAACGQVQTDPDAATGGPDAPVTSDGNLAIDAPGIDAPPPPGCGDGVVNGTDTCDDGANNGMYGYCAYDCTGPGLRCGDGTQNGPEFCDSGSNNGMYGYCNAGCTAFGPRCGDGTTNGPEACDSGVNNGTYGYCNAQCTALGPRCGDGVQNGPESCDSGANNGQYGFCNSACSALGPRCGDNVINGPESCDNGANNGQYGYCNAQCSALGPRCGDSIVQAGNGEQCDAGTVYSETMAANVCRPDCAGTVVQKGIGISPTRVTPAQGGIAGADSICTAAFGATYRALLVDGTNRVATVTANAGNGQVNWPVTAYTRYVSVHTNLLVFVSDNTRMIGAAGGTDRNLQSGIGGAMQEDNYGAWTGAAPDWTSSDDCNNWTSSSDTVFGRSAGTQTTSGGSFPNNNAVSNCAQLRRFFCVQQ
ncbi:MAG TPA: DUF1554 domain-containing protein [Kofleriaceae bacterium]|nr:DUF1554 domain-containing protein [Kofleriaceae bacterium]